MQFSLSPSPLPPPLTVSPPSPDARYEFEISLLRYTPIFLIVIVVFLICVEGGRSYREHYNRLTPEPEPQPQPRRLLRLQRSHPFPPRLQSNAVGSIISTYHIKNPTAPGSGCGGSSCVCSICLEDFQHGDECRKFVNCRHVFHRDCIDLWLARDRHCPLCRGSIRGVRFSNADDRV